LIGTAILSASGILFYRYFPPHYYYRKGHQAVAHGDLSRAQAHFDHYLERQPDDADVRLSAARVARRRDAYADAERHLTIYEQLQGVTAGSALERALLRAQQGNLEGVEARLKALASADDQPERVLILEALAKGSLAAYRPNEALSYLNLLLESEPGNVPELLLRAHTLEKLERDEDALGDYQEAVRRVPGFFQARIGLAGALAAMGRIQEAITYYEQLLQEQPDQVEVVIGLAHCRHDNHELAAAAQLLDGLLTRQPDCLAALVEQARVAMHQGKPAEAERLLQRAARLAPENQDVFYLLYQCLQAQHKESEAQKYRAQLRQLEVATAREITLMARLRDSPRDASLRYEIGMVFLQRGQTQEGLHWLRGALEIEPAHEPSHAALADFFDRTGQPSLALEHRKWLAKKKAD
jgi:tetratricopeptide (TPR) repeat protein